MTKQSDEIVERLARLTGIAGSGSLWWRPSLGQAVYDLLAAAGDGRDADRAVGERREA